MTQDEPDVPKQVPPFINVIITLTRITSMQDVTEERLSSDAFGFGAENKNANNAGFALKLQAKLHN
jgi:hypothetical protein